MPSITNRARAVIGVGVTAAVGVGVFAWRQEKKKQQIARSKRAAFLKAEAESKRIQDAEVKCLRDNYLKPGARLAEQVYDGLGYARRWHETETVIGLNNRTQANVFDAALRFAERGDTGDGIDMEDVVMRLLRQALPECEWSSQAWPAEHGSDWHTAYRGVEELLQLAILEMRYGEFKASAQGGGSGIVCPGWIRETPTPMGNARPNDFIELLVGVEKSDGHPLLEERVHAIIVGIQGENVTALILEPGELLPNGQKTSGPTHSGQHGYSPGMQVTVPKRCVFRLIKK